MQVDADGGPPPASGERAPGRLPPVHFLIFYVGVPALFAVVSGLRGRLPDKTLSLAFWLAHLLPSWWLTAVATGLAFRILAPWRPPMIPIALLGGIAGSFLAMLYTRSVFLLTGDLFHGINDLSRTPAPGPSWEFLAFYLEHFVGGILVWIAVNLFYDRILGLPRYRYGPIGQAQTDRLAVPAAAPVEPRAPALRPAECPAVTAPAVEEVSGEALPPLLKRLPEHMGRNVLALEAEEHYLKVHTDRGSTLILYRFADALEEMQGRDGLRVHRSFWVQRAAISSIRQRGKAYELLLSNGLQVPVSLTYKGALEVAGILKRTRRTSSGG